MKTAKNLGFKILDMIGVAETNMSGMRNPAAILTFHRVRNKEFSKIIRYLSRNYNVTALNTLLENVFEGKRKTQTANRTGQNRPMLAITFDDGYKNTFETAYAVLKKNSVPATVFLITGFIGAKGIPAWWDIIEAAFRISKNSPECKEALSTIKREGIRSRTPQNHEEYSNTLKKLPPEKRGKITDAVRKCVMKYLKENNKERKQITREFEFASWQDIKKCSDIFQYGSHTHTHPLLDQLSFEEQLREMTISSERIREKTGKKPAMLCYPNGNFNEETIKAAKKTGYKYALTTRTGWLPSGERNKNKLPDPYLIPRISINPHDTLPIVKAKIGGAFYKAKAITSGRNLKNQH